MVDEVSGDKGFYDLEASIDTEVVDKISRDKGFYDLETNIDVDEMFSDMCAISIVPKEAPCDESDIRPQKPEWMVELDELFALFENTDAPSLPPVDLPPVGHAST